MHSLAVLSMKNRALIALVTIVAFVFGLIGLLNLKQELIPSIEFPELIIVTNYPGASPQVVDNDVSTPISQAIQNVPDLSTSSATSSTNSSVITAQFNYGTDLDTASNKVSEAINQIQSALPTGVTPQVITASTDDLPVIEVAVTSSENKDQLGADINRLIMPDITKLDGVASASLIGQSGQRVTITPDPAKLAAAGLTTQSITEALQQNGVLQGAGSITQNGKTLSVQAGSQLTSVSEIASLPLIPSTSGASSGSAASTTGGSGGADSGTTEGSAAKAAAGAGAGELQVVTAHTIGDVATVRLTDNPITSYSRVNGEPALTISVTKLASANTVDVSNEVKNLIPSFQDRLGDGAKLTVVFDQAPYIVQSIDSLTEEGALGLLFAVIVILLFLLSFRSTLVTAVSIPMSILLTFIVMWGVGYTLNIITLGALTIAIGRVVDDSIVVIENIKRHMVAGVDRKTAVIDAVREVAGAVTASTITTVAVFLPVAFVGSEVGELFRPFALTVTIALLSSLLVALTIVPVLAYWWLRPPKPKKKTEAAEDAAADAASHMSIAEAVASGHDELEHPTRLQRGYLPIINWTLKHSGITIVIAVLVLFGTVGLTPFMTTNFLGSSGQNTLSVSQTFPPATSLQRQYASALVVEHKLRQIAGVETVQLSVGSSGSALEDAFTGGGNGATFSITTDPNADQATLQNTVQSTVDSIKHEGTITVSASAGLGTSNNIEVDVSANNQADLLKATASIDAQVKKLTSVNQVTSSIAPSLPYIAVIVDRAKAAEYGVSEVAVDTQVAAAMQPTQVGSMAIDDTTTYIYLDTDNPPSTVAQMQNLQITTVRGEVPLSTLATVKQSAGPVSVTTKNGLPSATVTATPVSANLSTANADVTKAIKAATLPAGASATLGGVSSNQSSAFSQLGLAMLGAILIVYVVMVATFKSLRQPLMLLISVPFAATGAIALQVVSGIPLGVSSLIGVLMLIGIVVTNAIVLVDLVNQYRRRGLPVPDAVRHGASRRLRPILMTATATIFALLPMAIGLTGHGGFISQPLAIVVIGGLVSSTILTLVVLPTLYNLVEGARDRRAARRAAKGRGDADLDDGQHERRPSEGAAPHGIVGPDETDAHHGIHVGRPGEGMPRPHHDPTHRGDPEGTPA